MDPQIQSMAKRRERHYRESKSVVAVVLMIFGVVALLCLLIVWPQKLSVDVFNSRLMFHLIIDVEDYLTCSGDYKAFVIDEPDSSFAMYTMFIFNITNPDLVITAGNEPVVQENGPFGFVKSSFKYDVHFDPIDSLTVSFKEYTLLTEVQDPADCEKMYHRTGRDFLAAVQCSGDLCHCKSLDSHVLVINPLFLKLLWEDTPENVFGHMSVVVFKEIKKVLDEPFAEAVKAHLVTVATFEVYQFRLQAQVVQLMRTGLETLLLTFTINQLAGSAQTFPTSCGLSIYNVLNECPWEIYFQTRLFLSKYTDLPTTDYPALHILLNSTSEISLVNVDYGSPKWIGLAYFYGFTDFNSGIGYTTVTNLEFQELSDAIALEMAMSTFGVNSSDLTDNQWIAAQRMVIAVASFLGTQWIVPYAFADLRLTALVQHEFQNSYEAVPCSPLGERCVYQWGFMKQYHMNYAMSNAVAYTLIDLSTRVDSNPNNLFKDSNSAEWYNSNTYCTKVLNPSYEDIDCTNFEPSVDDGKVEKPACMWAIDVGFGVNNITLSKIQFLKQNATTRQLYTNMACNISSLMYDVYRTNTTFHDKYVVKYLQKFADSSLKHNFTQNWTELGVIQWGGGYITAAIANVRTMKMINRNGMWRIGTDDFWETLLEYSSWAVKQGFPHAFLDNFNDANVLLNSLANVDYSGYEFRRNIVYRGTTLIGDGQSLFNNIGKVGEYAYTPEYTLGNFSCSGEHGESCKLLVETFSSSAEQCNVIQSYFSTCDNEFTFQDNGWIDDTKCSVFETSLTSSTQGIQCNDGFLYGSPHPYKKSRGNIVFEYLRVLTLNLVFKDGLWCSNFNDCSFANGGMFITTSPRKLLFDGVTDPFLLRYLHLKHRFDNVSYECVNNAFDKCGKQNFVCDNGGISMFLPKGDNITIQRDAMRVDDFFAPYYEMTVAGELIWKYSMDPDVAAYALTAAKSQETIIIRNLIWAAHPAWNSQDIVFNKFYQCQKRIYFGVPDLYSSCEDTLYTGRNDFSLAMKLNKFRGNESIYLVAAGSASNVDGASAALSRYTMNLWDGFLSYPYVYAGVEKGSKYEALTHPHVFHKEHGLPLVLSQDSLIFSFDRDQVASIPYSPSDPFDKASTYSVALVPVRVFVEDEKTWSSLQSVGPNYDNYGMPYITPTGMASLERSVGIPAFAGTPHFYGNKLWGGREYSQVGGLQDNEYSQRTFIDYDPVSGKALREVIRQQIQFRVTSNPINPILISSQKRCITPTKIYLGETGYGCFTYIPLMWHEDARLINGEEVFQLQQHFYSRPDRAQAWGIAGIVLCLLFLLSGIALFINEAYHKNKFMARVYVD